MSSPIGCTAACWRLAHIASLTLALPEVQRARGADGANLTTTVAPPKFELPRVLRHAVPRHEIQSLSTLAQFQSTCLDQSHAYVLPIFARPRSAACYRSGRPLHVGDNPMPRFQPKPGWLGHGIRTRPARQMSFCLEMGQPLVFDVTWLPLRLALFGAGGDRRTWRLHRRVRRLSSQRAAADCRARDPLCDGHARFEKRGPKPRCCRSRGRAVR